MWNRKLKDEIDELKESVRRLRSNLSDLDEKVWPLEHPAKFKQGDECCYYPFTMSYTPTELKSGHLCTILGVCSEHSFERVYYVSVSPPMEAIQIKTLRESELVSKKVFDER